MPIEDTTRFEEQKKVIDLYAQNINPTQIARELGLRRVDVMKHIEDWHASISGMEFMKDRVEELIGLMDEHYSLLIRKAYEIVKEVDEGNDGESHAGHMWQAQKLAALRAIAEFEKQRIDVWQRSGLLDAADMGEELADMEEQKKLLLDILQKDLCEKCHPKVMAQLAGRMGKDTVIVIDG